MSLEKPKSKKFFILEWVEYSEESSSPQDSDSEV